MAVIRAVPVEEALRAQVSKEPSARTLRTRVIEQDAEAVVQAVQSRGAATIDFSEEEQPDRYFGRLRAALQRKGYTDILTQKKRGRDEAVAWQMREEDKARVESRRRTGARLGQSARERAAKNRGRQRAN